MHYLLFCEQKNLRGQISIVQWKLLGGLVRFRIWILDFEWVEIEREMKVTIERKFIENRVEKENPKSQTEQALNFMGQSVTKNKLSGSIMLPY